MSQEAFFHAESGTVRFWVKIDEDWVGASVRQEALHYRFCPTRTDDEPLRTFLSHVPELEDAVRRRIAGGSYQPVILREPDLTAIPAARAD